MAPDTGVQLNDENPVPLPKSLVWALAAGALQPVTIIRAVTILSIDARFMGLLALSLLLLRKARSAPARSEPWGVTTETGEGV